MTNSNTKSSEKYHFNESISTNETGLASNQLHERSKISQKYSVNAIDTPRGSDKSAKYTLNGQVQVGSAKRNIGFKATSDSPEVKKRSKSISRMVKNTKSKERVSDGVTGSTFKVKKYSQKPMGNKYPFSKSPFGNNHYIDTSKISHIKPNSK
jgi:hypothetical protein